MPALGQPLATPLGGNPTTPSTREIVSVDIHFSDGKSVTAAGDYLVVSGDERYKQSIWHELVTEPGERKLVPGYGIGLPAFLKKPDTPTNRDELNRRILARVQANPLTERVNQVEVSRATIDGKMVLRVRVNATPKGQPARDFSYRFPEKL